MTKIYRRRVKGQTMPIVGMLLGLGVLIGLVAIAFDGGSALLQRRTQQNASEAGALAGVRLMGQNVVTNCDPAPCHPAYLLTNGQLYDHVSSFTTANRGGAVGAQESDYSIVIEYHYMADSPVYPGAYNVAPDNDEIMPEFVDGLRVTSVIDNPTTFGKALPNPISNLTVSGKAAALLSPTCSPEGGNGAPLPFTRMRAALEWEIEQNGNSVDTPYELWTSQGDLGGSWKNVISLNQDTFNSHDGITDQLITAFDTRNGPEDPGNGWPDTGLHKWDKQDGAGNLTPCTSGPNCADMRGSGSNQNSDAAQDGGNWVFWAWRGTISTTHLYNDSATNTFYPSTTATRGGTCCGAQANRPGDWAEIDYQGDLGRNRKESVEDAIEFFGTEGPLSGPPLNWGLAITRTVFVWGEPELGLPNDRSVQKYSSYTTQEPCSPPRPRCSINVDHPAWLDVELSGSDGNYSVDVNNNNTPVRVRFTKAYTFIFYAVPVSQGNSSSIKGFLINPMLPGPEPGSCTSWQTGSGVYYRQVDPGAP